jgi:hypothetical protein
MIESGVFECMFFSAGFPTLIAIDADIEKKTQFFTKKRTCKKTKTKQSIVLWLVIEAEQNTVLYFGLRF